MDKLKKDKKPEFNLIKYKKIYFIISFLFLLPSIFALIFWGLRPAIDFTGGSNLEFKFRDLSSAVNKEKTEEIISRSAELLSIQETGEQTYILKTKEINEEQKNKILTELEDEFSETEEIKFETLGPSIGKELVKKTILAVILAAGFILTYIAYRFRDKKYGLCAVLAMFHDTLILLGVFSFLGRFLKVEIDTLFVTAVLTTLSLSVHDTVVAYDRVRESIKFYPRLDLPALINKAMVETLTRSLNDSMTIIFMLLSLFVLGGETIRWFSLALLCGTVFATYSSTFIALPLLTLLEKREK